MNIGIEVNHQQTNNKKQKAMQNQVVTSKQKRKQLTIDDSICNQPMQKLYQANSSNSNKNNKITNNNDKNNKMSSKFNKTVKLLQPTNPFQDILNQADTPDFICHNPFNDLQQYSQIYSQEIKSPTFSDYANFNNFNNLNSSSYSLCSPKTLSDINNTQYMHSSIKANDYKYQSIVLTNKITNPTHKNIYQSSNNKNNKNTVQSTISIKKLTSGYKLKNHFNRVTPKIQQNKIKGVINWNEINQINNIYQISEINEISKINENNRINYSENLQNLQYQQNLQNQQNKHTKHNHKEQQYQHQQNSTLLSNPEQQQIIFQPINNLIKLNGNFFKSNKQSFFLNNNSISNISNISSISTTITKLSAFSKENQILNKFSNEKLSKLEKISKEKEKLIKLSKLSNQKSQLPKQSKESSTFNKSTKHQDSQHTKAMQQLIKSSREYKISRFNKQKPLLIKNTITQQNFKNSTTITTNITNQQNQPKINLYKSISSISIKQKSSFNNNSFKEQMQDIYNGKFKLQRKIIVN